MTDPMTEDYRPFREVAEAAAQKAGEILKAAYGRVEVREKGPADLVTEADRDSQRAIAAFLARECPDHTLLAEEDDVLPDPANPWRWVVDPLDGTMNFAHGLPPWCVSIGLTHRGRPVAGAVHVPLTGETFSASLGGGASVDGRPLRVSAVESLRGALVSTGLPTDFAADADRQTAYMRRLSTGTHSLRRSGSSAWNMAQVAKGALDLFYATSIHPWDVAAGVLLVLEAGGRISNLKGEPYDIDQPDILATNGRVHDEALVALAEAWPGSAP